MTLPAGTSIPLSDPPSLAAPRRASMFGHRPVGWRRHGKAVFVAAFVSAATQTAGGILAGVAVTRMSGGSFGPHSVIAIAVTTIMLWIPLFLIVFAQLAIGFTVARAALMLIKQNFGAAYLAAGLVIGMLEAAMVGTLKGATSPRDLVFAAATGLLAGLVYWIVASRERSATAPKVRPNIATAVSRHGPGPAVGPLASRCGGEA